MVEIKDFFKRNRTVIIISIIVIVLGSIFHFIYQWTNENKVIGLVTPVDESVWEHLKLILIPQIIAVTIEYVLTRRKLNNVAFGTLIGSLVGMGLVVAVFYTYVGAITHPKSNLIVDILIFAGAAIAAAIVSTRYFKRKQMPVLYSNIGIAGLILLVIGFGIFSYMKPNLPIFAPPPEDHQ